MTDDELDARLARINKSIDRLATTSGERMQRLEDQVEQLVSTVSRVATASTEGIQGLSQRLEKTQLRVQEQLGELAGIIREVIARQESHEQEMQAFRQKLAESDQRFEILLQELRTMRIESEQRFERVHQEIRSLIDQQHPPQDS